MSVLAQDHCRSLTRAEIFRTLPPIFVAWFTLNFLPRLRAQSSAAGREREARTIVEACDQILNGDPLGTLMTLLGRLRALTSVTAQEGAGGWALASQYEVLATSTDGLLSQRDRARAQRDLSDTLRAQGQQRGGALPARS